MNMRLRIAVGRTQLAEVLQHTINVISIHNVLYGCLIIKELVLSLSVYLTRPVSQECVEAPIII